MREYQTNKLHLKFDYETIERDFDIYQIKQKAEEKKYISQEVLDNVSEEQYITAVQWIYGNTALVLLEKDKISTYAFKKKMRERFPNITVCQIKGLFDEKVREIISSYILKPDEVINEDALTILKMGYEIGR